MRVIARSVSERGVPGPARGFGLDSRVPGPIPLLHARPSTFYVTRRDFADCGVHFDGSWQSLDCVRVQPESGTRQSARLLLSVGKRRHGLQLLSSVLPQEQQIDEPFVLSPKGLSNGDDPCRPEALRVRQSRAHERGLRCASSPVRPVASRCNFHWPFVCFAARFIRIGGRLGRRALANSRLPDSANRSCHFAGPHDLLANSGSPRAARTIGRAHPSTASIARLNRAKPFAARGTNSFGVKR